MPAPPKRSRASRAAGAVSSGAGRASTPRRKARCAHRPRRSIPCPRAGRDRAIASPPRKVEGEVDRHQRVDEQLAPRGPVVKRTLPNCPSIAAAMLPLTMLGRPGVRLWAWLDGARGRRALGIAGRHRERPQIAAVTLERRDVLQDVRVADAVIRVDAEADARDEASTTSSLRPPPGWSCPLPGFPAPLRRRASGCPSRRRPARPPRPPAPRPGARTRRGADGPPPSRSVDGRRLPCLGQPLGEPPLGEVAIAARSSPASRRASCGARQRHVGLTQVREREVRQKYLLARRAQRTASGSPAYTSKPPPAPR